MTKKAKVPSPEEMKRLFKILSSTKNPVRDKLIVLFSYGLGLRALEIASIKLWQLFRPDGSIKQELHLTRTKADKPRTIYLPDEAADKRVYETLREYFEIRKTKSPWTLTPESPLFITQHGGAFTNRSMQKRFEQIYAMAGIDGASSHSGRRSFATKLIEGGADIKAVSTLMGHSSIHMTEIYVQDNPDRLKNMVSNLFSSF
jgi:integrase/recombinase XerD